MKTKLYRKILSSLSLVSLLYMQIVVGHAQVNNISLLNVIKSQSIQELTGLPTEISTKKKLKESLAVAYQKEGIPEEILKDLESMPDKFSESFVIEWASRGVVRINGELSLDLIEQKIRFHGHEMSFEFESFDYVKVKNFLEESLPGSHQTSFLSLVVSSAHAVVVFGGAVIMGAITSLVAVSLGVTSNCNHRADKFASKISSHLKQCKTNLEQISSHSKKSLSTSELLEQLETEVSAPNFSTINSCKELLNEEFRLFWSFIDKKSCMSGLQTQTACKNIEALQECLVEFDEFDDTDIQQGNRRDGKLLPFSGTTEDKRSSEDRRSSER